MINGLDVRVLAPSSERALNRTHVLAVMPQYYGRRIAEAFADCGLRIADCGRA
jgi:hypothetical protein